MSFSALGRQIGLSAPAVIERVRRMEDGGVIKGYRLAVDVAKLDYEIQAVIRVSATEEHCVRLGALVRTLPGVIESHRVTGAERLVLRIAAPSIDGLDDILRQLSQYGTATASVIRSSTTRAIGFPRQSRETARRAPPSEPS